MCSVITFSVSILLPLKNTYIIFYYECISVSMLLTIVICYYIYSVFPLSRLIRGDQSFHDYFLFNPQSVELKVKTVVSRDSSRVQWNFDKEIYILLLRIYLHTKLLDRLVILVHPLIFLYMYIYSTRGEVWKT